MSSNENELRLMLMRTMGRPRSGEERRVNRQVSISLPPMLLEFYDRMGGGAWVRRMLMEQMMASYTPDKKLEKWRYDAIYHTWIDSGSALQKDAHEHAVKGYLATGPQIDVIARTNWERYCPEDWLPLYRSFSANGKRLQDYDAQEIEQFLATHTRLQMKKDFNLPADDEEENHEI